MSGEVRDAQEMFIWLQDMRAILIYAQTAPVLHLQVEKATRRSLGADQKIFTNNRSQVINCTW